LPDRQTKALITQIFSLKASSFFIFDDLSPDGFFIGNIIDSLAATCNRKKVFIGG
jgi:hypothetical protein